MTAIFEFLWNSDIARLIGGALAALLAFWGYGAAKERKGKLAAQKQAAAKSAAAALATEQKRKEINAELDAETDLARAARDAGIVRGRKP